MRTLINARRLNLWLSACGAILSLTAGPVSHAGDAELRTTCTSLASLSTPGFKIEKAEWVGATRLPAGPAATLVDVPDHCLFRVTLDPRLSGLEEMSYGIGIEVRFPADWNHRFFFQGGGGLDGVLLPAVGAVGQYPSALSRGFAVVSTDSGHRGKNAIDSRFGADQQAKLDFAYQAIAHTTQEAKALVTRFYGKKPDYSYYMGCSTGGREAMLAAQRLPLEFDGVVAGNPSYNLTRVAINQIWSLQTVTRVAPKDSSGRPDLSRAFSDEQLKAVSNAVLRKCDALDGLRDGMINDFQACRFDPKSLVCGSSGAPAAGQCLGKAQSAALNAIFGGARNSRGEPLYGTFPFDTGIAAPAWRGMHLGTAGNPPANATLGRDTLRNFAVTPPAPDLDPLKFDFDRDVARTYETAAINDAVGTLHTSFAAHGGKMIVYHGLSDQAMATGALTGWYEHLSPRDAQGPQAWARLFLVPGMTHCGGGQSTDRFDMLSAIQAWVEEGQAPDRVIASGTAFPGVTRPLCPFPKVARFDGGPANEAKSFSCR
jgi:hypothetical protein